MSFAGGGKTERGRVAKQAGQVRKGLRVLVVDDDPVQRQMAAVALRMGGHETVGCEDGGVALSMLKTDDFDVALIDHEMPGMSGFAVMLALAEQGILSRMPVVYVTSRDNPAVIERAFELGASGFVAKPVNWSLMQHQLRFVVRAAANERAAGAALEEALRLSRTKEQLLNITRHELRTPLHAVIGFGRIIRDGLRDDPGLREASEQMLAAAERLNRRIADMMVCLDLAGGRVRPAPSLEDPTALIEDRLPFWRRQAAARGLNLSFERGADGARMMIDASHFLDIVGRLVENALAHGGRATAVSIAVRQTLDDSIAVAVSDDGEGIAPDIFDRCAAPFSQDDMSHDRCGEGLGLGLHIARGLAVLNGMTLALGQPGPNAGAVVVLAGPAAYPRMLMEGEELAAADDPPDQRTSWARPETGPTPWGTGTSVAP